MKKYCIGDKNVDAEKGLDAYKDISYDDEDVQQLVVFSPTDDEERRRSMFNRVLAERMGKFVIAAGLAARELGFDVNLSFETLSCCGGFPGLSGSMHFTSSGHYVEDTRIYPSSRTPALEKMTFVHYLDKLIRTLVNTALDRASKIANEDPVTVIAICRNASEGR